MTTVFEATILGASLHKVDATLRSRICMMETEMMRQHPGWVRLLQIHWQVQVFTHLKLHEEYMLSTHGRLSGVWSKLLAMTLVMYNKILLLDTDLLVRSGHDLEELWEYPAPAGIMRGTNDSYTGTRRPRTTYFREGKLIGGINGGVILLQPDQEVFNDMMGTLNKNEFQTAGRGAEQDFWSWWFAGKMLGLPRKYNLQVHQLCVAAKTPHHHHSEWARIFISVAPAVEIQV